MSIPSCLSLSLSLWKEPNGQGASVLHVLCGSTGLDSVGLTTALAIYGERGAAIAWVKPPNVIRVVVPINEISALTNEYNIYHPEYLSSNHPVFQPFQIDALIPFCYIIRVGYAENPTKDPREIHLTSRSLTMYTKQSQVGDYHPFGSSEMPFLDF